MLEKYRREDIDTLTNDELSGMFIKAAERSAGFKEATDTAVRNAAGQVWMIGGFIYRTLVQELYGTPITADVDFDYIIEAVKEELFLPPLWYAVVNSFGNPKLKGPKYEIDLAPLGNIFSIKRRELEPTLENFLTGVPLSVQSIAYDVKGKKMIGEIGISAIKSRTIGLCNQEEAEHYCQLKGITVDEFLSGKAESLGFSIVY